jgi:hypothetical protein
VRTTRNLLVTAGLLLLPAVVDGRDLQLASAWAPTPAKVDGTADTWSPLLRPLGDLPMVIGVQNDADFLYLCLKTSSLRLKEQLTATGLTVWANGTGKANASNGFGIRYPLMGGHGSKQRKGGGPAPTPAEESTIPALVEPPSEFELIGPTREDRRRVDLGGDEPVAAALGDDSGVMVLELRLPLRSSGAHPLAAGAAPGRPIALQLVTEMPKRSEAKRWADHVGRHSVEEGRSEDAPEMPSPFSVWLQVTLATPPAQPAGK